MNSKIIDQFCKISGLRDGSPNKRPGSISEISLQEYDCASNDFVDREEKRMASNAVNGRVEISVLEEILENIRNRQRQFWDEDFVYIKTVVVTSPSRGVDRMLKVPRDLVLKTVVLGWYMPDSEVHSNKEDKDGRKRA